MNTSRQSNITRAFAICVAALCLHLPTPGHATSTKKPKQADNPTTATTTGKKPRSVKIKHQQNNSEESAAQRDRRLYRECQGLPNAGACLGYARR